MMNSLRWILHFVWCLVALAAPWGKTPRVGSKESEAVPDPRWITDAPLVVAARCNDGVIVLAEHNREPLVWLDPEQPTGRLVVLDRSTTLVAVGWRPDGAQLARWGRTIVRTETETFGSPVHPAVVAQELAVLLATRRVSEQMRTLSSVALVLTSDAIWKVDDKSAESRDLQVVGGGARGNETLTELRATLEGLNMTGMCVDDGLPLVIRCVVGNHSNLASSVGEDPLLEIATLRGGKMTRHTLSSILEKAVQSPEAA